MSPRGSLTPVVASGTASVVKLLVATLAFVGAYAGIEVPRTPATTVRAVSADDASVETVELSSKSMQETTAQVQAETTLAEGTVTVTPATEGAPCDRPYEARSVIGNPHPERTVTYGWRLQRWSESSRGWRTYLSGGSGFTGERQSVEWQPRIAGNPGLYRVTLSVPGRPTAHSARFRVSC
ncbi:hypothetical protein ABT340_11105 [Streptosporangium sp. NPDC000239]|uniref:hypothetical protein n=1 Tax=Streptosporangium sp. NPDC000239 TaxID=3154248 RepID=UPI003317855B